MFLLFFWSMGLISIKGQRVSFTNISVNMSVSSRCEVCNFEATGPVGSTSRDGIFIFATQFSFGMEMLVKSIRSCGCRARIIVFTQQSSFPTKLITCGVEFVAPERLGTRGLACPWNVRFEWYYTFLKDRLSEFDRILHLDGRDTFVLADPFSGIEDLGKIYFVGRGVTLGKSAWDMRYILATCLMANERLRNGVALNCGLIIGGAKEFYLCIHRLLGLVQWNMYWVFGTEQALLNVVLHGGDDESSSSYVLLDCSSNFPPLNGCYALGGRHLKADLRNGYILPAPGGKPIYVAHQYDRFPEIVTMLGRVCGYEITREQLGMAMP